MTAVITQNIDGLHQTSGVPDEKVIELHGNSTYAHCLDCRERHELSEILEPFARDETLPNGRRTIFRPDGTRDDMKPNGMCVRSSPDGSISELNAVTGELIRMIRPADGVVPVESPTPQHPSGKSLLKKAWGSSSGAAAESYAKTETTAAAPRRRAPTVEDIQERADSASVYIDECVCIFCTCVLFCRARRKVGDFNHEVIAKGRAGPGTRTACIRSCGGGGDSRRGVSRRKV